MPVSDLTISDHANSIWNLDINMKLHDSGSLRFFRNLVILSFVFQVVFDPSGDLVSSSPFVVELVWPSGNWLLYRVTLRERLLIFGCTAYLI